MEALGAAVSQLGFPIAIAVWFVYQNKQMSDKYIEESKRTVVILDQANKALELSSNVIERNTEAFNKLMNVLEIKDAR